MSDREPEFATRYANANEARQRFGAMADAYARCYRESDPLADDLAAYVRASGPAGRETVEQALRGGLRSVTNPDPTVSAFFEHYERVPPWVDFELINCGARAYQRLGMAGMLILGSWSLLNGYHSAPAVKPLAFTGALNQNAPRRLAQTANFVSEVTQVDGLRFGADGYRMTANVRLIHAHVRHACSKSPEWRFDDWGTPINQADMLGTILEFSWLVIEGARRMGFRIDRREGAAIFLLWRYCAYLSGIKAELLEHLVSEEAGTQVGNLMHLIQPGPDDDSRALTQALLEVPLQNARNRPMKLMARYVSRYHIGLARAFNGDAMADGLGLPDNAWKYALYPTRAVVGTMEFLRDHLPGATRLATYLGNHIVRRDIASQLRG
jgi:hypothetical protein